MHGLHSQPQFGTHKTSQIPQYKGVTTQSVYVPMRDGVKIAVDVNLPQDLPPDARAPAILIMARYWRSFQLRMEQAGKAPTGPRPAIADFLASYGYAVVTVDVRGSGASLGTWQYLFSRTDIDDMSEVITWVISQPWSNGTVGAIGHSYEGTMAELLTVAHPTAVKAVVPQEMEFDLYTDIVLPGGILNDWFVKVWDDTNRQLDANQVPKEWGFTARLFVKGVRPVDGDKDHTQLRQAIAEHGNNTDVYPAVQGIMYRDDPFGPHSATLDDMSVFNYRDEIERSGVPIFGWGSWLDGAFGDTVLRRFVNFSNPQRAVIGAWSHNLQTHGSPYGKPKAPPFPSLEAQWQESLRFLDHHLMGMHDEGLTDKVLFYFTMGEERWKATTVWPPTGTATQRWYLAEGGMLSQKPPVTESGEDTYTVDFEATTGKNNRWHTPDGLTPVIYKDRAKMDRRLLTYTSPPLAQDTEISGHAVVTLYVASNATDGAFYVYLEDVDERGRVTYVTEGQLRAIHRKVSTEAPPYKMLVPYHSFKRKDAMPLVPGEVAELTFGLLSTSVLIKKGHRIRIAIAGHDKDTFARIPAEGTPVLSVQRNSVHASYAELPIVGGP
jgi:putative CocE/NonD family hydrolase